MNLTEEPEIVDWAETHYVFIEKTGPFMSIAPQAWKELFANLPGIAAKNKISQRMTLYKGGASIYRAGVALAAAPVDVPAPLQYEKLRGGKFTRFVLTGPYSDLPQASGRVWQLAGEKQINVREDFAIENYVNDPRTTPEAELITEILVPTA
jgi:effector-binding domain-containing protein